jgi:cytochrome subunit of sulfide dehydrogenase
VKSWIGKVTGLLMLPAIAFGAQTASADDQAARSLAANCTGCHGPGGRSSGAIPPIAGLDGAYLLKSLQDFKSGARPATVMHQLAKGYSDAEIESFAEYFAKQPRQ